MKVEEEPENIAGVKGRIKGLNQILKLEQFTSKSQRLIKDMQLIIYLDKEYHELLEELPENISLKNINEFFKVDWIK